MSFKNKDGELSKRLVRPQITYLVPLEEIPRIFERLASFNHLSIKELLDDLNPTIELKPLSSPPAFPFLRQLWENKKAGFSVRIHFKSIAPAFSAMPDSPAKGLILLFLHYWHELFNGKDPTGQEPGLKQYIGLMSRVPFSDLYDNLEADQKKLFSTFLESHVSSRPSDTLRSYSKYDGTRIEEPAINILAWFESITKKVKRVGEGSRKVDLMSPPPALEGHSMGYFPINSIPKGFALIEARGYVSITNTDLGDLNFEKIKPLIDMESRWFFGE